MSKTNLQVDQSDQELNIKKKEISSVLQDNSSLSLSAGPTIQVSPEAKEILLELSTENNGIRISMNVDPISFNIYPDERTDDDRVVEKKGITFIISQMIFFDLKRIDLSIEQESNQTNLVIRYKLTSSNNELDACGINGGSCSSPNCC